MNQAIHVQSKSPLQWSRCHTKSPLGGATGIGSGIGILLNMFPDATRDPKPDSRGHARFSALVRGLDLLTNPYGLVRDQERAVFTERLGSSLFFIPEAAPVSCCDHYIETPTIKVGNPHRGKPGNPIVFSSTIERVQLTWSCSVRSFS